jgi:hypothetical protein
MPLQTGENEQGLRKMLDLTRGLSIVFLLLHFYWYNSKAFEAWHLTFPIMDRMMQHIGRTGLFDHFHNTKLISLAFLLISMLGVSGKKEEKLNYTPGIMYVSLGLVLYFGSYFVIYLDQTVTTLAEIYLGITSMGYLLVLAGGILLTRVIQWKLVNEDIFNKENESFPQEERLLENEYSLNLPARYLLKGKVRNCWINIVNPFRSLLVAGSPGSGKTHFIIRHLIAQHIQKGFAMFIYDFKYDDLSRIAYHYFLQYQNQYSVRPGFYVINFDDLEHSHRCNPLYPGDMEDITDAAESARTMMLCINRSWILRQGDFFVESPINFVTAIIWFLRRYKGGQFCTLPHVIELMQVDYDKLFTLLRTEPEIDALINPFVSTLVHDVMDQLEGQVGGAKIALSKLSSPNLYYILSGNDFALDINNPQSPKILCVGNNPQKQLVYNPVLSLYISRLIKLVNRKGNLKSSLVFDEFPTVYLNGIDTLVATARSNKVATTLVVQDLSQLRKDYGREQADVIMNITGNMISGQVMGETAKQLSERFGRIMQKRSSMSINSSDISNSRSLHLDTALPPSTIASLSSGEFVGMVADDPDCPIALKAFHCKICNEHDFLDGEPKFNRTVPVVKKVDQHLVQQNYLRIKQDIRDLVDREIERILNDPSLVQLIIRREK